MVDHYQSRSYVQMQQHIVRSRHGNYIARNLDPKIARTFTDDIDIRHGLDPGRCYQYRPGQRDDEMNGAWNTFPTVL